MIVSIIPLLSLKRVAQTNMAAATRPKRTLKTTMNDSFHYEELYENEAEHCVCNVCEQIKLLPENVIVDYTTTYVRNTGVWQKIPCDIKIKVDPISVVTVKEVVNEDAGQEQCQWMKISSHGEKMSKSGVTVCLYKNGTVMTQGNHNCIIWARRVIPKINYAMETPVPLQRDTDEDVFEGAGAVLEALNRSWLGMIDCDDDEEDLNDIDMPEWPDEMKETVPKEYLRDIQPEISTEETQTLRKCLETPPRKSPTPMKEKRSTRRYVGSTPKSRRSPQPDLNAQMKVIESSIPTLIKVQLDQVMESMCERIEKDTQKYHEEHDKSVKAQEQVFNNLEASMLYLFREHGNKFTKSVCEALALNNHKHDEDRVMAHDDILKKIVESERRLTEKMDNMVILMEEYLARVGQVLEKNVDSDVSSTQSNSSESESIKDKSTNKIIKDNDNVESEAVRQSSGTTSGNVTNDVISNIFTGDIVRIDNSSFQGFCVNVKSGADVKEAEKRIRESHDLMTHLIVAYRLNSEDQVGIQESCWHDGEHGADAKLLHLLQSHNMNHTAVFVARWYGGRHLGPKRFDLIVEAARKALSRAGKLKTTEQVKTDTIHGKQTEKKRAPSGPVDHVFLHDSTGSKLWGNKLVPSNDRCVKLWCPTLSDASSVLEKWDGEVKKSVVLITGIRDARSFKTEEQVYDQIKDVVDLVMKKYPGVTIVFSSVLPHRDRSINENVIKVNNAFMVASEASPQIKYCDTNTVFQQKDLSVVMDQGGNHVLPRYLGILARPIKDAITPRSAAGQNQPTAGMEHKGKPVNKKITEKYSGTDTRPTITPAQRPPTRPIYQGHPDVKEPTRNTPSDQRTASSVPVMNSPVSQSAHPGYLPWSVSAAPPQSTIGAWANTPTISQPECPGYSPWPVPVAPPQSSIGAWSNTSAIIEGLVQALAQKSSIGHNNSHPQVIRPAWQSPYGSYQ